MITPQLRAVLDVLDNILVQGDVDAKELWTVLSALRGPDIKQDYLMKHSTTSVIRAVAFPKASVEATDLGGPVYASMTNDSEEAALYRSGQEYGGHFMFHAMSAFSALGLKWGEVNPPVK